MQVMRIDRGGDGVEAHHGTEHAERVAESATHDGGLGGGAADHRSSPDKNEELPMKRQQIGQTRDIKGLAEINHPPRRLL
jgi:hypothetical protein